MTPGDTSRRARWRTLLAPAICVVTLAAGLPAMLLLASAQAQAAAAPWTPLTRPWEAGYGIYDISTVGAMALAVAGDGRLAITRDGGHSWNVVVPTGYAGAVFTAVAADASGHGIAASGGTVLQTDDWGGQWQTATYVGPGAEAAIDDVALRDSLAIAVGDDGTILSSSDTGTTWGRVTSPTLARITCVTIGGDHTAVAGTDSGEILVGYAGTWTIAATLTRPVTSVAASSDPTLADGVPDLFAATGSDVVGCDLLPNHIPGACSSLPNLPDLTAESWPTVAWLGIPSRSLLLAGAEDAGFYGVAGGSWLAGPTGLSSLVTAAAPGGQSVAYVLGGDGGLLRTMSAGRVPATTKLASASIQAGARTRLSATVNVDAPGFVVLKQRIPGRAWKTLRTTTWATGNWGRSLSFLLGPSLTHEYRLDFRYGDSVTPLASATRLVVSPRIATNRSRIRLRVGDVYRFSGSVMPRLPGETLGLYTDRGGRWRPVNQGAAALSHGRTWTSRKFGTPRAETYHLRAHLPATAIHGEAWSRVVTVIIR